MLLQTKYPVMEVEHSVRSGLDHAPILIILKNSNEEVKCFRFLNFWLKEESFMEVVKQN